MSNSTQSIVCQIRAVVRFTLSPGNCTSDEDLTTIAKELEAAAAKIKDEQANRTFWHLYDGDAA